MGPQIWHTGATMTPKGWEPDAEVESPSGLLAPGKPRGKAMTEEDIADTVAAFAQAAADAEALGLRYGRDPRRPRLSHRRVLLARHQPARPIAMAGPRSVSARALPARSFPRSARLSARISPSSCASASGSSRISRARLATTPAGNGGMVATAGRSRRRYSPLFAAPLLGARIPRNRWRSRAQFRRLGEEAHRRADDQRRLGRAIRRFLRRLRRPVFARNAARRIWSSAWSATSLT